MPSLFFDGQIYYDDRLYILHICRCAATTDPDGSIVTTIYHESPPDSCFWCVVMYRNTARYPAVRVDHFDSLEAARAHLQRTEPTVPRISLGGRSPATPPSYEEFLAWKAANGLRDYDYTAMYSEGGSNPREVVVSKGKGKMNKHEMDQHLSDDELKAYAASEKHRIDRIVLLDAHVRQLFTEVNEAIGQMQEHVDDEDLAILCPDAGEHTTAIIEYGNLIRAELFRRWDELLKVA